MRPGTLASALSRAGAAVGAVALTAMIVIITAQVLSRRVLAAPMVIADELSGWLLVVVTFSALGYALKHGDHIRVTLLVDRLGERPRAVLRLLGGAIGAAVTALLAWRTGVMAWDSYTGGTFSIAGSGLPLWPVHAFMPLGFAILLLQMLAGMLEDAAHLARAS
jgi:TRAP-type C4-dicarboxylate transport system permease small subunit